MISDFSVFGGIWTMETISLDFEKLTSSSGKIVLFKAIGGLTSDFLVYFESSEKIESSAKWPFIEERII